MPTTPQTKTDIQKPTETKQRQPRPAMIEFLRRLIPPPSPTAWYKRRQRIARQLEIASGGELILLDNACRADGRLHIRHADCECVFYASLRDIKRVGAQHICPYCNLKTVDHLGRFGSVQAIREFVEITSLDCLEFSPDNILSSSSCEYEWRCLLHNRYPFTGRFEDFAKAPHDFCPICRLEHRP